MRLVCLLCVALVSLCSNGNNPVYTYVTNLFDIKRGELQSFSYRRSFSFYLSTFQEFLKIDSNLIIFGPKRLQNFIWERRREDNTVYIVRETETLMDIWYAPYTERIRQKLLSDPEFKMKNYPQFALPYYNPMIMSKLYFLNEGLAYDKFNSDYFIWCDAGYNHIFQSNVVSPQNMMTKYYQLLQPQWTFFNYQDVEHFMNYHNGTFPYIGRAAKKDEAILAGNFGGYIRAVRDAKSTYQNLLRITLERGDLNSDESVVALLYIRYTYLFPGASHLRFDYYAGRININQESSREPSHPRLLHVNFDEDGNILARDEKKLIKYQIHTMQIQQQIMMETQFIKWSFLLKYQSSLYESVLYRYFALLAVVLLLYSYVLRKTSLISKDLASADKARIGVQDYSA